MAGLPRSMDFEVVIDHGHFVVEDPAADVFGPAEGDLSRWTAPVRDLIRVIPEHTDGQSVAVRLEHWTQEPDTDPPAPFGDPDEGTVELSSGSLGVRVVTEAVAPPYLDLDGPGRYAFRAYRHGGQEALRLWQSQDEPVRGAERILIRFWPAPS
ncbi:hypothetical protein GCM10027570_37380 [Streptomonospora sediminis]